jgi:RHH-type proline utilization regulon transcriptional repressor/proline dehydrogenase/delta 1-pyrroline-5-carboxylate dehydrogenase
MKTAALEAQLSEISSKTFLNEKDCIKALIKYIQISDAQWSKIDEIAVSYVEKIRASSKSPIEDFIHEFSLSTDEGVAIICLAEAFLRIPDQSTAIEFVEDKLKGKDWKSHIKKTGSLFVNASAIGLLFTGALTSFSDSGFSLNKLISKLGMRVVLKAIKQAIKIISNEYILGSDIKDALKNSNAIEKQGYRFSFDILGESSRTAAQADYYYKAYIKAISDIEKSASSGKIHKNHNLSVKLSALHPRVIYRKKEELRLQLLPKLKHIVGLCRDANIAISFDAEESYRQDIYLEILTDLILDPEFAGYEGVGFVIQAYQKRTFFTVDYIISLAEQAKKRIPVRLVKGAYWDSEIKFAQEFGLENYPVFTSKEYTDVSYIACAQKMLSHNHLIYPQFATHNAHTVSVIKSIAAAKEYEFQRLQGMGAQLHDHILAEGDNSRIYAPVGRYEDLLAYLMRRLLENGANSSFVNLLADTSVPISEIVENPVDIALKSVEVSVSTLTQPSEVYHGLRKNSLGFDLGFAPTFKEFESKLNKEHGKHFDAYSIIGGKSLKTDKSRITVKPADHDVVVGKVFYATDQHLRQALDNSAKAFKSWSTVHVSERAEKIRAFAETLHENRFTLYSLLIREGGKNIDDAISEVREAIDFAYYYSAMSERYCAKPIELPHYTGEKNTLSWHPKGVFVCISPWNFPLAIFLGQILAALATGNTVLAKPADNTPIIATFAFELLYKSGIDQNAAQLLIARGRQISDVILPDNRVMGVCFTGSTEVAHGINRILAGRNGSIATFIAETGGQNCMIVDSSALPEQVADSIIHSAFGSIGQRCSALRVAYIQDEIYDCVKEIIIGAMNELTIGDTEELSYDLGPVIDDTSKTDLMAHLKNIVKKDGCSLLAIHSSINDKLLKKGSFIVPHIIEIDHISRIDKENFGPVLHLRRYKASELENVIDEINSTNFGLTFGIQTRIADKITDVASKIHAGNLYANRTIIGAQVGAHPFGGENNSGTGFKAGGPHYLYRFMNERALIINTTAIGGNIELLRQVGEDS